MYSFETSSIYSSLFKPGKKYVGVFGIEGGVPDFEGEKESVTSSYSLEKILDGELVVWEKASKK